MRSLSFYKGKTGHFSNIHAVQQIRVCYSGAKILHSLFFFTKVLPIQGHSMLSAYELLKRAGLQVNDIGQITKQMFSFRGVKLYIKPIIIKTSITALL